MDNRDVSLSILQCTKKMLGLLPEMKEFDVDILALINSAMFVLFQLGVIPKGVDYRVNDEDTQFTDIFSGKNSMEIISAVKQYIFIKVKLGFDISTTPSAVIEVYKEQAKELEWRLNVLVDKDDTFDDEEDKQ